ncbi:MAG: aspartate aminotransferase family protein [Cytophagaceae bacterium]|nr:aspartate aminotransferase family protein [Cytophagaceae bacterium]|tara:strand:- start:5867 stop:7057 length:1191 start_codon:yes stop_codon:yes gene_type:complete
MKDDFLKFQAQTTPHPLAMEVSHAQGSHIYDTTGKEYLDFVAGVSACTLGHCHPKIVNAIKQQSEKYLHVMVYGEYAQDPAVKLTKLLAQSLPDGLDMTYLVNSGTEAIDGALKLARRITGRTQILAAENAYHGNTYGALSLMSNKERQEPFAPLVGDVGHIRFNNLADLEKITPGTAAVILETIQGGAGFILPQGKYLKKVRQRCDETGAMLILDEIQPGYGRTGKFFGFQHYDIVPDILVMGKGMGGGMPIGAFMASAKRMRLLSHDPKLGHITTFGGHPVIAAAALATTEAVLNSGIMEQMEAKEALFRQLLVHTLIVEVRGKGLMLAVMTPSAQVTDKVILACQDAGLVLFWLLFEPRAIRITPPLTITDEEIRKGCQVILDVLDKVQENMV